MHVPQEHMVSFFCGENNIDVIMHSCVRIIVTFRPLIFHLLTLRLIGLNFWCYHYCFNICDCIVYDLLTLDLSPLDLTHTCTVYVLGSLDAVRPWFPEYCSCFTPVCVLTIWTFIPVSLSPFSGYIARLSSPDPTPSQGIASRLLGVCLWGRHM